jgi:fructokinase
MRIGVHIGATDIDTIALAANGSALMRERVPSGTARYEETLDILKSLVGLAERRTGKSGTVGIAFPGSISAKTGRVKNSNNAHLIGANIVADAQSKLGRELRFSNDANCFTLSEASDGSGTGCHVVVGVILDAGVGGGMTIDKNILAGANAIAGEWGHNPLPWSNDEESARVRCYCGKAGCTEQFLSISGLQRAFKARSGQYANIDDIFRATSAGEANAVSCMAEYIDRLARALAAVINVIDPDVIVLGGSLSTVLRDYNSLQDTVARYAFTDRLDTRIRPALHGDASTVRGAAMLWPA